MLRATLFLALFAAVLGARLADSIFSAKENQQSVWIVIFNSNVSRADIAAHHAQYQPEVRFHYEIDDFRGYAAPMNTSMIKLISMASEVSYVEADQVVSISQSCGRQSDATWGLDRINEVAINLDGSYTYTHTGTGVHSYIVDTGIYLANRDFEGRAVFGQNFAGDGNNNDCNGHGTHVAGTVGSKTWGVAKKTTLVAVKVLGCDGSGTNAGVIAGINFVATDAKGKKAIANMSLGGGKSTATNTAVAKAVATGVTFVVAAGNDNADACNYSPASEPLAISVGATTVTNAGFSTQADTRASFSNFGACTDIFAPGQLITSTWIGSPTAEETISGTSMAAPHVAGAVALLKEAHPSYTPAQIRSALLSKTTNGVINLACTTASCRASPNQLLHTTTCSA